jgi:hypothetical protein
MNKTNNETVSVDQAMDYFYSKHRSIFSSEPERRQAALSAKAAYAAEAERLSKLPAPIAGPKRRTKEPHVKLPSGNKARRNSNSPPNTPSHELPVKFVFGQPDIPTLIQKQREICNQRAYSQKMESQDENKQLEHYLAYSQSLERQHQEIQMAEEQQVQRQMEIQRQQEIHHQHLELQRRQAYHQQQWELKELERRQLECQRIMQLEMNKIQQRMQQPKFIYDNGMLHVIN